MPANHEAKWYHCNRYSADSACEHCAGIIRHEAWCSTQNAVVEYAHRAVANPGDLSEQDRIVLHALGVEWK